MFRHASNAHVEDELRKVARYAEVEFVEVRAPSLQSLYTSGHLALQDLLTSPLLPCKDHLLLKQRFVPLFGRDFAIEPHACHEVPPLPLLHYCVSQTSIGTAQVFRVLVDHAQHAPLPILNVALGAARQQLALLGAPCPAAAQSVDPAAHTFPLTRVAPEGDALELFSHERVKFARAERSPVAAGLVVVAPPLPHHPPHGEVVHANRRRPAFERVFRTLQRLRTLSKNRQPLLTLATRVTQHDGGEVELRERDYHTPRRLVVVIRVLLTALQELAKHAFTLTVHMDSFVGGWLYARHVSRTDHRLAKKAPVLPVQPLHAALNGPTLVDA
mmetsp:Transcript_1469/g.3111  ORF Transcript_1469/g.3111 Transcript_1469/m.3111 type:complete len:329 (+) Transcript_1469:382-1368(+)